MKTFVLLVALSAVARAGDTVQTANGVVEGGMNPATGVRMFKGIPFAQPPVGDLRWKEPQPPKDWTGVRKADQFGPRCAQRPVFGDMKKRLQKMATLYKVPGIYSPIFWLTFVPEFH